MILDYSGKGATEIFQDLVTRQGVRLTDLADLYRKTGATNETEVPAFIKVENNSIVDYSDTPFAEETEEVTTESASPELQNYLTTTEMTLAEPQPGVETFNIQKQDPRFSVQNEVMRQQEQNLPTLDMPEAVAEPPAQMNVGEEVVSVQDVPGPTPEVPEMVPEDAQKVLAGEPLKEPEAKPAEAEGSRAIEVASTIMPETGTRTITEEELKAYPMKVQQVVDNFFDEGGYTFFDESAELPFKADIDKVDERIKALDDRLNQISNEQIKPYFGKEDTGRKIMAAIAAGLGAYASAMSGTPNYALQILNKAIDDDLEKQKTEMAFKRQTINDQRLLLTEKRQELLTMAEMQLNKAATMATSAQQQQKLKIMLTEVLLAKDSNEKRMMMDFVTLLQKRQIAQREGIVPGMGATAEQEGITNLKGEARTQAIKSSLSFMTMYHEAEITVDYLKNLMKPVKEGGEPRWKLLAPAELSETRTYLIGQIENLKLLGAKKLYEFGAALTPLEKGMLDQIVADANRKSIAFNVVEDRLNNFYKIMQTKREALIKAYGFTPVNTGTTPSQAPQSAQKNLPKSAQAGVFETN
tara:strand:- start:1046 stop:2791 length:1746 start_codon:yes stop_codon:yes gene_type:complete